MVDSTFPRQSDLTNYTGGPVPAQVTIPAEFMIERLNASEGMYSSSTACGITADLPILMYMAVCHFTLSSCMA